MPATKRISEEAAVKRTGKGWTHWFSVLDRWRAFEKGHTTIAKHLREKHGVSGWWSQEITVTYERERGMRKQYQRAEGHYEISVSRVVRTTRPIALRAIADLKSRRGLFPREAGRATVEIEVTPKARGKAIVRVTHSRLASLRDAEALKRRWSRALDTLRTYLEGASTVAR